GCPFREQPKVFPFSPGQFLLTWLPRSQSIYFFASPLTACVLWKCLTTKHLDGTPPCSGLRRAQRWNGRNKGTYRVHQSDFGLKPLCNTRLPGRGPVPWMLLTWFSISTRFASRPAMANSASNNCWILSDNSSKLSNA